MNPIRKGLIAVALVGSTLTGGALGAVLVNGSASAATTGSSTTAPVDSSSSGSTANRPSGRFTPHEDATHEASESPAREAQEDAGQFPTVP